jgi:hypothetical protein
VITKDFVIAKTFRSPSANFFRQEKTLRDHEPDTGIQVNLAAGVTARG